MNDPVHVCILTTAHAVDDPRVNHKICASFREAGFRVSWVGPGHVSFDERARLQEGVEFFLCKPNRTRLDRLRAGVRVQALARQVTGVDVYYAPEPDSARIALRLARGTDARVILDIHEMYHDALLDRWTGGKRLPWLRELVRRRIASTCRRCSLVVGVSKRVLEPYVSGCESTMVIRSCAPGWFSSGGWREDTGSHRPFTIMHGRCHRSRGTLKVLGAIRDVRRTVPEVRLLMFGAADPARDGEGAAVLRAARSLGVEDALTLRRGVPMQEMPGILRACDVGLISYGRDLGVDSLPNRLFEYMAAGLPVIAPAYAKEIAAIVEAEGCGVLTDFEDSRSVAEAILRLQGEPEVRRKMGNRAREAFLARHNWESEVLPLLSQVREWSRGAREA